MEEQKLSFLSGLKIGDSINPEKLIELNKKGKVNEGGPSKDFIAFMEGIGTGNIIAETVSKIDNTLMSNYLGKFNVKLFMKIYRLF